MPTLEPHTALGRRDNASVYYRTFRPADSIIPGVNKTPDMNQCWRRKQTKLRAMLSMLSQAGISRETFYCHLGTLSVSRTSISSWSGNWTDNLQPIMTTFPRIFPTSCIFPLMFHLNCGTLGCFWRRIAFPILSHSKGIAFPIPIYPSVHAICL